MLSELGFCLVVLAAVAFAATRGWLDFLLEVADAMLAPATEEPSDA